MQPEPERVDLSPLDVPRFDHAVARVANRARELRALRRIVGRRAVTAAVLVAAAALALWLAPTRPRAAPASTDILSWATGATPEQVLNLGGNDAQ